MSDTDEAEVIRPQRSQRRPTAGTNPSDGQQPGSSSGWKPRRPTVVSSESENENEGGPGKRLPAAAGHKKAPHEKLPETKKKSKRRTNTQEDDEEGDVMNYTQIESPREMASKGVLFLLIVNSKMTPIKRAELVKHVMTGAKQATVKLVLMKIQKLMKKVFGIHVYGLNESTREFGLDLRAAGWTSFLLISTFTPVKVPTASENLPSRQAEHEQALQSLLFIMLSVIFMTSVDLKIGVKEETIWRCVKTLQLDSELEIRPSEFTKFVKTEFGGKQYLVVEEKREEEQQTTSVRYYWGPRAQLEYSKTDILIYMAKLFNLKPEDFTAQYKFVLESSEGKQAKTVFSKFVQEEMDRDMEEQVDPDQSRNRPVTHVGSPNRRNQCQVNLGSSLSTTANELPDKMDFEEEDGNDTVHDFTPTPCSSGAVSVEHIEFRSVSQNPSMLSVNNRTEDPDSDETIMASEGESDGNQD